jgi:hypothetical protein
MSVFQIQAKDTIVKLNHYATINAVQNFQWDPAFNEEQTEELGNAGFSSLSISPELTGSFESLATGSSYAILSRMWMDLDGSGNFLGYKFASGTPNAGTIHHTDLEFTTFDLIVAKQANDAFTRSDFFPRVSLSSISFSGDANGNARETYNFEGELMDVYRDPYHDIISLPCTRDSSTQCTAESGIPFDTEAGALTSTTHTVIALQVNEEVIPDTDITVGDSAAPGTGPYVITITGSQTIPVGARIMVWLFVDTPGTFPTIYNPTSARFVRANKIDMWLVKTSEVDIDALADGALNGQAFNDTSFWLRVQSFDMNIDLRREALRQIKRNDNQTSVYYRAATYPLQITANATTFETDLDDWVRIQEGNATPSSKTDTVNLGNFDGKEVQLVVRYYYNTTVIQTMALTDARVTGMGNSTSVGGRGEVNWTLSGSVWRLEGDDV